MHPNIQTMSPCSTSESTRILLVDDHALVREGLKALVAPHIDLKICGEASDISEALRLIKATSPEMIIVDLSLKGSHGLDLIKKVKASGEGTKLLVVSAAEESLFAERALLAGAHGYINKQDVQCKIIDAIRALMRGELYLSPAMQQRLLNQALVGRPLASGVDSLSDRELQIYQLIGRGNTTRSIAKQLHLSVHTVESHRENIRTKLQLRDGTQLLLSAVRWAFEHGVT